MQESTYAKQKNYIKMFLKAQIQNTIISYKFICQTYIKVKYAEFNIINTPQDAAAGSKSIKLISMVKIPLNNIGTQFIKNIN